MLFEYFSRDVTYFLCDIVYLFGYNTPNANVANHSVVRLLDERNENEASQASFDNASQKSLASSSIWTNLFRMPTSCFDSESATRSIEIFHLRL